MHFLKVARLMSPFGRTCAGCGQYTLIASLIAVAAIVAMGKVGTKIQGVLTNVSNAMT